MHLSGSSNIPSDFACRNATPCPNPSCQICSFITHLKTASVLHVSIQDILDGPSKMPFLTRSSWISTQGDCQALSRTKAHLLQETRLSKRDTKCKDVKRYLQSASIATDGLLVVKHTDPFLPSRDRIVISREMLPGLLTALHIRLNHSTIYKLKKVCHRCHHHVTFVHH